MKLITWRLSIGFLLAGSIMSAGFSATEAKSTTRAIESFVGNLAVPLSIMAWRFWGAQQLLVRIMEALASTRVPVMSPQEGQSDSESAPSQKLEFILCLLLPAAQHEDKLGDFGEHYRNWVRRFGSRRATILYFVEVLRSAIGFRWIASIAGLSDLIARVVKSI
jgi:hypothetical protein